MWSYGYRNPWRLRVDPHLGVLVGSAMWKDKPQQVNAPHSGDNAGYPEVETPCWTDGVLAPSCSTTAAGTPIAPPVLEYGPEVGDILSGVAVPGPDAGPLAGTVVVSDWKGAVLAATPGEAPWATTPVELPPAASQGGYLWDLDADAAGHLYLMYTGTSMTGGTLLRLSAP